LKRLGFGWLFLLLVLAATPCAPARAASPAFGAAALAEIPVDGTFRSVNSLSRYERASLLSDWLDRGTYAQMSENALRKARAELNDYRLELAQMGVVVENVDDAPGAWKVLRQGKALDAVGAVQRSWVEDRMTAVDVFWTNPSSPLMRMAYLSETSGRPTLNRPRLLSIDFLTDWTRPRAEDDFLTSTLDQPMLASTNLYAPGLGLSPASMERMRRSSRLYPASSIAMQTHFRTHAGLDMPAVHPTPFGTATPPAIAMPTPRALNIPSTMYRDLAGRPTPDFTLYRDIKVSTQFDVRNGLQNTPWTASAPSQLEAPPSSTMLSRDYLRATNEDFAQMSARLNYQLPHQNLRLNVRLDELSTRPGLSAGSLRPDPLDLRQQNARINLDYNVNPNFSVQGGYMYSRTTGRYATGLPGATLDLGNINLQDERGYPYLGFDYKVSKNTRWNLNVRFYNTLDIGNGARGPNLNLNDPAVTTEVKVTF